MIHCSYTPPSMDVGAEDIRSWHVNGNGWDDIGYHWVIKRNGQLQPGRPEEVVGAHVKGKNARSIGVCLVGGKQEDIPEAECNFTLKQWNTLRSLLYDLKGRYPGARITGHNDHASRACPTFNAKVLLDE